MNIVAEVGQEQDTSLLIGHWADLVFLIDKLNGAWEAIEYRLEKIPGGDGTYLFIEDYLSDDSYECGIIEKRGSKAYAFSNAVHDMVMGAYLSYVEEFGIIAVE